MVLRLRNLELVNDSAGHQFSLSLVGDWPDIIQAQSISSGWFMHLFVVS